MVKPDYTNSIVNLMSSIQGGFGKRSRYKELQQLPSKELKKSKNVVLMVFDGLGYEFLKRKESILAKNMRGKITSVFPPTTAAAITTFLTGTAPQQHAFTGWFMLLKELGIVSTILPFNPRIGGLSYTEQGIKVEQILGVPGLSQKIQECCYIIQPEKVVHSPFSKAVSKRARRIGYNTLNGFFRQIKKVILSHHRRKYIYAYWPMFDSLAHKYGINSTKTEKHFNGIDRRMRKFVKSIAGSNTTLLVTADHGHIDTSEDRVIKLEDHPALKECLTLPLCGEPRTVYCYVHPSKKKQFESYVRTKLKRYCTLYKSHDLISNNYYGLFQPNPQLIERIGDYILIMKENYILKDRILSQKRHFHVGNHGGISKEEMFVPLVVVKV